MEFRQGPLENLVSLAFVLWVHEYMESSQGIIKKDLDYIGNKLKEELACMEGKKLLITGGGGFLGYYLVQSILNWNNRIKESQRIHVTIFDSFIRSIPKWLVKLENNKNLTVLRVDVTDPLNENIDDFHYIMHAASIASPTYYREHPIKTMDANVNGLRYLLEHSRKQKEKPLEGFLFYSSSEIYGDPAPGNIPTPESYNGNVSCIGPRACYDESKRYGETLCVNFAQQYDLPIKIVRPFNNYGPGLKITDRRVIPDFARDIMAGRNIIMYSDGSPTRTFCYVADAIVGYFKVLVRGRKGEAYNIGVEEPEISIREVAHIIVNIAHDVLGYKGRVIHQISNDKSYLIDNPKRRCPIISKARTELGYNPAVSLQEGLKRSMIWYCDNCDAEEG